MPTPLDAKSGHNRFAHAPFSMHTSTMLTMRTVNLPAGQVDLWYSRTHSLNPLLLARYPALLTPDERAQHVRFHFLKDRLRYLVTRALVRHVLSHYVPIPLHAWRFEADSFGRPQIAEPREVASRIAFNITHTDDLVAVAVTHGSAIGIDTESMQRTAPLQLVDRHFAPFEIQRLRGLPPQAQAMRFWELWTLKESYIKARGMGLSIPLDRFAFDLDTPGGISVAFADGFDDSPARWHFMQLRLAHHHLLALCIEAPGPLKAPVQICLRESAPLDAHQHVICQIDRCSIRA